MKRLLSFSLAVILTLSTMSVSAAASEVEHEHNTNGYICEWHEPVTEKNNFLIFGILGLVIMFGCGYLLCFKRRKK